jgi:hypothetical protein
VHCCMQVRRYGDLPRSAAQLSELCSRPGREQDITPDSKFQWRGDLPVVAFGKYSGTYLTPCCFHCIMIVSWLYLTPLMLLLHNDSVCHGCTEAAVSRTCSCSTWLSWTSYSVVTNIRKLGALP